MADVNADGLDLSERLEHVRQLMQQSAHRSNRDVSEITLVAISKNHPVELLSKGLALGLKDLGENKVQEAEAKIAQLDRSSVRWHMVGHLQANKARRAVQLFDFIQSVDSETLARRLNRLAEEENQNAIPILIQVDLAGEATKSGIQQDQLPQLLRTIGECRFLSLRGLMVLPPFFQDAELARPYFKRLRELRDRLQSEGHFAGRVGDLSMGMSHDFEVAIEEGATIVRIGTAIFGERKVH